MTRLRLRLSGHSWTDAPQWGIAGSVVGAALAVFDHEVAPTAPKATVDKTVPANRRRKSRYDAPAGFQSHLGCWVCLWPTVTPRAQLPRWRRAGAIVASAPCVRCGIDQTG